MKILLIDDHKLFSLSIKIILEKYEKIHEVKLISIIEELNKIHIYDYDIILIDINLTNISTESGLEVAEKLIKKYKNIRVVILTGHVKLMYERQAEQIGAKGFIDKNIEPDELMKILEDIFNEGKYFQNINYLENSINTLTDQEIKILDLLRKGKNLEEISELLYISKRTVSNHLNHIYSKLYVHNKQEAVYKAEQLGYFLEF